MVRGMSATDGGKTTAAAVATFTPAVRPGAARNRGDTRPCKALEGADAKRLGKPE